MNGFAKGFVLGSVLTCTVMVCVGLWRFDRANHADQTAIKQVTAELPQNLADPQPRDFSFHRLPGVGSLKRYAILDVKECSPPKFLNAVLSVTGFRLTNHIEMTVFSSHNLRALPPGTRIIGRAPQDTTTDADVLTSAEYQNGNLHVYVGTCIEVSGGRPPRYLVTNNN